MSVNSDLVKFIPFVKNIFGVVGGWLSSFDKHSHASC